MKRLSLAVIFAAGVLSGCAPRGESKDLDEILLIARNKYQEISKADVGNDVGKDLEALNQHLESISGLRGNAPVVDSLKQTAEILTKVTDHSGYTQRTAMTELATQYRQISASKELPTVGTPVLKLLAARTFTIVTAELESTKFKL